MLTWLESLAKANPGDNTLKGQMAQAMLWSGSPNESLELFRVVLAVRFDQPNLWPAFIDAASSAARDRLTKADLALLGKIAAQPVPPDTPEPALYLSRLGWTLYREGQTAQALPLLDLAVKMAPTDPKGA